MLSQDKNNRKFFLFYVKVTSIILGLLKLPRFEAPVEVSLIIMFNFISS